MLMLLSVVIGDFDMFYSLFICAKHFIHVIRYTLCFVMYFLSRLVSGFRILNLVVQSIFTVLHLM